MTPQTLMKSRVNTAFLVMVLTLGVQSVVSIPSSMFVILSEFGVEIPSYYTDFVLLQLLYPIGTCLLALIALRIIKMPTRSLVTVRPIRGDFIPYLGVFLGVTVVMNYTVNFLLELLERMGIQIPDVFDSYTPRDLPQAICYFIVLAILPPICEEILCRGFVCGLLKHFHPWTAVFVSSFAFAMMHATVQQIPFAFVLGVVLGFIYVKTGNLLYPILLHFVNNAYACLMTYLSVWASDAVVSAVGYGADLLFVLFGVVSLLWLIRKKQITLKEIPHSLTSSDGKHAVGTSPWFWVFTGLYAGMTLLTEVLLMLEESQITSL
ncbi:MAG: CPBP family intramembrane metalloprotease [Clostridia bacterium]|nr:CPBP family intramembrane metalloprotease [Clostridia bacterium]